MLFYSIVQIKLMIKNCSKSCLVSFQIELFASKKCSVFVLHIENLINNKINSGIKHLMNIVLNCNMLHAFLKYEMKNWVSDVNFEIKGKYSNCELLSDIT